MTITPKYELRQGDDLTIIIPVRDSNNIAIDLSLYEDVIVTLSYKNTEFAKYRLNIPVNKEDEYKGTVTFTDIKNEIVVDLSRTVTKSFVVGLYDVTISLFDLTTGIDSKYSNTECSYILVKNNINKNL